MQHIIQEGDILKTFDQTLYEFCYTKFNYEMASINHLNYFCFFKLHSFIVFYWEDSGSQDSARCYYSVNIWLLPLVSEKLMTRGRGVNALSRVSFVFLETID